MKNILVSEDEDSSDTSMSPNEITNEIYEDTDYHQCATVVTTRPADTDASSSKYFQVIQDDKDLSDHYIK